ncbi:MULTISPECIES: MFS transporter [unclassified Curtobacterium]|uniref:MFS transporter n=1 Tax=unclassified Curtobacterium TaxID=257496 RepID=UPI000D9314F7|nr:MULTISPECIES: MFS transporter [unclassified Curtobacterium]PYY33671.1 MFS transporter [Curtobacterium sp. MCBD17_030]PZE34076.1 MFS transporter [Curtobacterium sp. MCPF17_031]
MDIRNGASQPAAPRGRGFGHGAGFWIAAATFFVVMAYSTAPTPLWGLLQQRDGFSTFAITIAFAAYAVGVVISLFLVGHLGDTVGRRPLVGAGVVVELVSAVVFLVWPALSGLIVARVLSGLGVGMLTATITAHIMELHRRHRPGSTPARGQIVSGAANLGGFGAGALVSGVLAQWAPAPTVTPFAVFLVLMVLALVGITLVPETASSQEVRAPYRPQRIRVPADARGVFLLAGGITFAAFAVLGLFTSLVPVVVAGQLHITSPAASGSVVFVTFTAGAVAQILLRAIPPRRKIGIGAGLLAVGIALVTVVVVTSGGLASFFVGGIVSGAGAGLLFTAALATAGGLAAPEHRGEVLAGIFLVGYIGLTVPVVGIGVATLMVSLTTALTGFAVVIIAAALLTAVPLVVATGRRAA